MGRIFHILSVQGTLWYRKIIFLTTSSFLEKRMKTINSAKALPFHYAWIILAVGTLVVFGALGLARFGYTMVLPAMQLELGLNNTQAGGLATANLIGYLAFYLFSEEPLRHVMAPGSSLQ
jgi:hypothetical protein